MGIKISKVMTISDWFKISVLLVISIICWIWVYQEWQKPILPPEWNEQSLKEQK